MRSSVTFRHIQQMCQVKTSIIIICKSIESGIVRFFPTWKLVAQSVLSSLPELARGKTSFPITLRRPFIVPIRRQGGHSNIWRPQWGWCSTYPLLISGWGEGTLRANVKKDLVGRLSRCARRGSRETGMLRTLHENTLSDLLRGMKDQGERVFVQVDIWTSVREEESDEVVKCDFPQCFSLPWHPTVCQQSK